MDIIEAVLFDLDDTLVDRRTAFRSVVEELYECHPSIRESHSREAAVNHIIHCDLFDDRFERIIQTWPGMAMNASDLRTWYYEALERAIKPDKLALSFLADLNREGMPWGIVTNGDAFQYTKLRLAGIQDIAPFVIVSGDFGVDKPSPAIFKEALRRLKFPPAHATLFVGDNADTDIKGAQQVGMLTAWIRLGRRFPPCRPYPNYVVEHVDELRPLLLDKHGL